VDNETTQGRFESVFSTKVRAGKRRTYFFDVRRTKGEDYYITLTESTKRFNGDGYDRHKIFLYKEDFNRFLASLTEAIDHVKGELMPNYDYDEFTRRQEEWDKRRDDENHHDSGIDAHDEESGDESIDEPTSEEAEDEVTETSTESADADDHEVEEDMSW
jgi:hypothetical protein